MMVDGEAQTPQVRQAPYGEDGQAAASRLSGLRRYDLAEPRNGRSDVALRSRVPATGLWCRVYPNATVTIQTGDRTHGDLLVLVVAVRHVADGLTAVLRGLV